jgi:hypothetical protein
VISPGRIDQARLEQVAQIVERAGLGEQTLGALREAFTDIHLTYCMDDDIGLVEPAVRAQGFNMYLVDGRGHCMRFTNELETATGIVLAEVEEAEDE